MGVAVPLEFLVFGVSFRTYLQLDYHFLYLLNLALPLSSTLDLIQLMSQLVVCQGRHLFAHLSPFFEDVVDEVKLLGPPALLPFSLYLPLDASEPCFALLGILPDCLTLGRKVFLEVGFHLFEGGVSGERIVEGNLEAGLFDVVFNPEGDEKLFFL